MMMTAVQCNGIMLMSHMYMTLLFIHAHLQSLKVKAQPQNPQCLQRKALGIALWTAFRIVLKHVCSDGLQQKEGGGEGCLGPGTGHIIW
jgi:hypothetical protein